MPLFRKTARRDAAAARRPLQPVAVENLEHRVVFDGTLGTATDLGAVYGLTTRTGTVSGTDVVDYYKFKLAAPGKLTVRLTNLTANADLRLVKDANNNGSVQPSEVIGVSTNGGTTGELIFKNPLSAGTYFARVNRVAGAPSYKLSVKTDYAGNSFFNARNLGSFIGTKTFKDRVDVDDKDDFYKVVLVGKRTISATLTGTGDAHLELSYDSNHNGVYDEGVDVFDRSNGPTSAETINPLSPNAGTYFIRVLRGSADAQYTVNIKVS